MEQRTYLAMLFVLMVIQMAGVFYLIFNSPHNSYPSNINSGEITHKIQRELQLHLRKQENNGKKSATSAAVYQDNKALHTALRNIVREELIVFFSSIQDNTISGVSKKLSTLEYSISVDKTGLSEMNDVAVETALNESKIIIDTAKADGVWTMENTMAISVHAFKLPIKHRRELHKDLQSTVARGGLKLEGALPDF